MQNALKRYELTDESKILEDGTRVHRIRALEDIPTVEGDHFIHQRRVYAGDLGGWVEDEECLSQAADSRAWIFDDAVAYDGAFVSQKARLYNSAVVSRASRVGGKATIGGKAVVTTASTVFGGAAVFESATLSASFLRGGAQVRGNASVVEGSNVSGYACVGGEAYVHSSSIAGNATIFGRAKVLLTTARGGCSISGDAALFKCLIEDHAKVEHGARMIATRARGRSEVSMDFVEKFNVVFIDNLEYCMTFTDNYLRVGCQQHSFDQWRAMSPRDIDDMDGTRATWFYPHMLQIMEAVLAARKPVMSRALPKKFQQFFEAPCDRSVAELLSYEDEVEDEEEGDGVDEVFTEDDVDPTAA